jgi:hypothetical protein
MKEDVKEKNSSPPLRERAGVVTCIQPCHILRGGLVWLRWARRRFQRQHHLSLLVPT